MEVVGLALLPHSLLVHVGGGGYVQQAQENMIIDMNVNRLLGSGVYADVFELYGRAYKVFRSRPEVPPRQTREGRRRVFQGQCEAFRLLSHNVWLQNHTAAFHGICTIDDVIARSGVSVKSDYLLDCCYILELLDPGDADPETGLFRNEAKVDVGAYDHLREAVAQFNYLGISTLDSSVFCSADPEKFKFIDIEMKNYY
jgi:hypothetical protein